MRMERCRNYPKELVHRECSIFSYYGSDHSATQSGLQFSTMPMFIAREMEEGDVPKEETLDRKSVV